MMKKTKIIKSGERTIESLIKKNFSKEFMKKIYDIYSNKNMSIVEKTIAFDKYFNEEFKDRKDYRRIGEGTNRFVCLLDNHIIKVAYNYLAYIDNMNELAMSKVLPRNMGLALAYETNGIILVSEYVTVMDKEDFMDSQLEIKNILLGLEKQIKSPVNKSKNLYYILGDMGMSSKNYGNWGRRANGEIVVLDYGYLYQVTNDDWKRINRCPVCNSNLEYTDDYTELRCLNNECGTTVKYTTLRNFLGYKNIIDNINSNLNKDEYVKFDKEGKINVDIYEKIEYVVEEKKIEIPEDIQVSLDETRRAFEDMTHDIKRNGEYDIYTQENIIRDFKENKDKYYEPLFPILLSSVKCNKQNVEKYIKDFEIQYEDLNILLLESLKESMREPIENEDEIYNELMSEVYDENKIGYDENNNQTDYEFVDKVTREVEKENDPVYSSIEELLGLECGTLIDIEKFENHEDEFGDEMSLDEILETYDKVMKEEDDDEIEQEEITEDNLNRHLQLAYNKIKDSLTEIIRNVVGEDNCIEDTPEIHYTILNGDHMDYDYPPEVNAENVLGGWKPDDFAFPLYRHILITKRYDGNETLDEFEARYRIGDKKPKIPDTYDEDENLDIVLDQILDRFGELEIGPSKRSLKLDLGKDLNKYFKLLDMYYDNITEKAFDVGLDNENYYFEGAKNNTELMKSINEATENLKDDLLDENLKLDDMLKDNKIIYYYDYEALFDDKQYLIADMIKSLNFVNKDGSIKDIKKVIRNEFYKQYQSLIPDSSFDIFKYGQSVVINVGYKNTRRPLLKAKLVPKNMAIDKVKPIVFNRVSYVLVRIEQRYGVMIKDNKDELSKLQDLKAELNRRNLYYSTTNIDVYNVKKSRDFLRYLMTENECKLLNIYEEKYGISNIKDKDKLYANTIVDLLDEEYHMSIETRKLFNNIANKGINEALAERSLIINILELNGQMSRLEYLDNID